MSFANSITTTRNSITRKINFVARETISGGKNDETVKTQRRWKNCFASSLCASNLWAIASIRKFAERRSYEVEIGFFAWYWLRKEYKRRMRRYCTKRFVIQIVWLVSANSQLNITIHTRSEARAHTCTHNNKNQNWLPFDWASERTLRAAEHTINREKSMWKNWQPPLLIRIQKRAQFRCVYPQQAFYTQQVGRRAVSTKQYGSKDVFNALSSLLSIIIYLYFVRLFSSCQRSS